MRKLLLVPLVVLIFCLTLSGAYLSGAYAENSLMTEILARFMQTGAQNAVTAIYLDYRIFDTLFETFLLLVSVMGMSQFLRLETTERIYMEAESDDSYTPSPLARSALRFVLPVLVIFGLTVTAFGAASPGGGFQGGSILATIVMVSYLSDKRVQGSLLFYTAAEEWLYIGFLALVGGYFLFYRYTSLPVRFVYLVLCNFMICFKVNMGLIIIFLRLVGRSQHRTEGNAYE